MGNFNVTGITAYGRTRGPAQYACQADEGPCDQAEFQQHPLALITPVAFVGKVGQLLISLWWLLLRTGSNTVGSAHANVRQVLCQMSSEKTSKQVSEDYELREVLQLGIFHAMVKVLHLHGVCRGAVQFRCQTLCVTEGGFVVKVAGTSICGATQPPVRKSIP